MLPSRHIMLSAPLGLTAGYLTQSAPAGLLCFLVGILVDVDHVIEYLIHYGLKASNVGQFYWVCRSLGKSEFAGGVKKIYLFFHAIEIVLLLWVAFVFSQNIYLLAIALGYTGHIVLDATGNVIKPWGYLITVRIKNGFIKTRFVKRGKKWQI